MFESFGIQRFVTRWLAAMFLVLASYNPSGYSYYHWISELDVGNWVLKLLVGVVLAILYATFGLATQRSLGRLGIAGSGTVATIVLVNLANLLAVGVSWSYVRARLSGQADTNNVTLP